MNDVYQLLAQAGQSIQQAMAALQQYGQAQQAAAQQGQVQQGLPQQQAFGNPGGMQGAVHGNQFAQQNPAQNVAQQGLPGQQGALGQQFGGGFGAQGGTPQITADTIQTLITPMVQNEQVKAALQQAMLQQGIQNLPDARPDQLPALYQAFKQIEQQAQQAGLLPQQGQQAQQQQSAPGII